MLLRLIIIRLCPIAVLGFIKNRKQMKRIIAGILLCYILGMAVAIWKVVAEEKWIGFFFVPISLFPQYIFYGIAIWCLLRCIWYSWSARVWKRVHLFSLIVTGLGIFMEKYVNSNILQIFFNLFI